MTSTRACSPTAVALAGMGALAVSMGVGRFAFTPILPMMQVDAGLSTAGGGWLAAANYAGTLLGALSATGARVAAPTAIRAGLVTIGVATLAMGLGDHFWVWVALRALAGIATAWVLVFASAWALERLTPLHRPALNSTVFAGYGVGIAGAGTACLGLMLVDSGSTHAWASLGALALAVTVVLWPAFGAAGGRAGRGGDGRPRRGLDTALLVLCYGTFGFGYIVPATFLPVMARAAIEDPSVFGWSWPLFGAAAAGATFAAAALSRFVGNRRLWSLSHVVMAVGVVLPVVRPGIVSIMLSALLVGATFTVTTMAGFQEAQLVGAARAKDLIAAMASAFSVGQIAGIVVATPVAQGEGGFRPALVLAGAVLLASACALAWRGVPRGRSLTREWCTNTPAEPGDVEETNR